MSIEDLGADGPYDPDELPEDEDAGPEPLEYRPVLVFTLVLVALTLLWSWLNDPSPLTLGVLR